jgi:hypothetical protein
VFVSVTQEKHHAASSSRLSTRCTLQAASGRPVLRFLLLGADLVLRRACVYSFSPFVYVPACQTLQSHLFLQFVFARYSNCNLAFYSFSLYPLQIISAFFRYTGEPCVAFARADFPCDLQAASAAAPAGSMHVLQVMAQITKCLRASHRIALFLLSFFQA